MPVLSIHPPNNGTCIWTMQLYGHIFPRRISALVTISGQRRICYATSLVNLQIQRPADDMLVNISSFCLCRWNWYPAPSRRPHVVRNLQRTSSSAAAGLLLIKRGLIAEMTLWRCDWPPVLPFAHVSLVFELEMVVVERFSPEIAYSLNQTDHGNTLVPRPHHRRPRPYQT